MRKISSLAMWGAAVLFLSSLTSCEDLLEQYFPKPTPPPTTPPPTATLDIPFYALAEDGRRIDAYSTRNPTTRLSSVSITTTGDRPSDRILGLDFRPATGQLYGVSSSSRVYVINPQTGVARLIPGSTENERTGACICTGSFSMDFDPTTDRIRVVAFNSRNRVINPETGAVEEIYGPPPVVPSPIESPIRAMAYSNSVAGTSSTTLYAINAVDKQLYRVTSANDVTIEAIGKLNLPISGAGGMDIDAKTGTALAVFPTTPNVTPTLFTVDLTTGAATTLAQYTELYRAIAIPTRPVAYASSTSGNLYIINLTNPEVSAMVTKPITGLGAGEAVIGLDFRPANGQLYALTVRGTSPSLLGENRLYTINAATGAATFVATLPIALTTTDPGFDFNPVADRIRIVTASGQNLRVNPTDGTVVEDGVLNPSDKGIYTAAYSNNFAGTTSTTLYVMGRIGGGRGEAPAVATLYQQTPPNNGTLVPVGDLGIPAVAFGSFDIGGASNKGYAVLNIFGATTLYTIDLATGKATIATATSNAYNSPGPGLTGISPSGLTVGLGF